MRSWGQLGQFGTVRNSEEVAQFRVAKKSCDSELPSTPNCPQLFLFATLLQQLCHEPRPAGLMASPNACTSISVKIFIEEDEVLPMRVGLKLLGLAIDRSMSVVIPEKEVSETTGEITGHFP